jgi:Right handed beta helix region
VNRVKLSAFFWLFCVMAESAWAADGAPFRIAETGQSYYRLDEAVNALGKGAGTIIVAPGTYKDCAIFGGQDLTLRAATPSTAIFDGGACGGKATLVLNGMNATIDGIVFQNIRVPDGNGAGIRLEWGDLHVVRSTFRNSEEGILTGTYQQGAITVERSTFSGLGGCPESGCSHGIYVGGYGKLTVTRCRFERGTGGHYVKSRAPVNEILDSSFDDSGGRNTNYMIDLPAGSTGLIARNVFVQGRGKENHSALIAVAAEARDNPSAGLRIEDNDASLAPGAPTGPAFVADWSHEPLKIGTNKLGAGIKAFEVR